MNVMGIIFANDAKMGALTDMRTLASLPYGGRYRQVDFALSNLAAAGVCHVGLITRHNYQSLINHVGSGEEWGLELEEGGLEYITPYAASTVDNYRGKLESIYTALPILEKGDEDLVVMIDAAVLCNIDLKKVLQAHVKSGRDITVVAKDGIANGKKQLDLAVKLNDDGEIADLAVDYCAPKDYLAGMDIYVLSKSWLMAQVREHIAHNLYHMDRDLVLNLWQKGEATVNVYPFDGVALFNETVEEYFRNSLALIEKEVRHDLFVGNHPVYTKVRDRVPCYYGEDSEIKNCIIADGCVLNGKAENCVIFRQVTIDKDAKVENSVIMNDTVIGEGAQLKYVILDKDVTVRPGTKLFGTATTPIIIKRGDTV